VVTTALVTGITGQDGGYLAELLVGDGTVVHGTRLPGEPVPEHLTAFGDLVQVHPLDLRDDEAMQRLLEQVLPDEIYNLAGISSVAQSWQVPALTSEVNGVAVARLLELVRGQQESGRQVRLLQASSAEVFAGASTAPQDERTPIVPRSPYGAAKAFAHHLVQVLRAEGLHASNVVLFNHESPRRPLTFVTRKITSTAAAIARGEADELVLGNLDARRDWGWAPDYVDGMVRALRHPEPGDYVLATGIAHSVADFVAAAFARVGIDDWQPLVRTDPAFVRPSDPVELVGNAGRARQVLDWAPTVPFEELVGRMVDADMKNWMY
jgi:GDPmannose 4,6-dehydratase